GSRLLTGVVGVERAAGLRDASGVSWVEAMRAAGKDPAGLGADPDRLARIGTYLELHVEQGRGLVHLDAPVALGGGLYPHGRWRLSFTGRADHAGTAALADRDDPMLALARTILTVRQAAERHGALATVGRTVVHPNGTNVVPARVD